VTDLIPGGGLRTGGERREASDGAEIKVADPADGSILASVSSAGLDDDRGTFRQRWRPARSARHSSGDAPLS
jgi:hypothetical protein